MSDQEIPWYGFGEPVSELGRYWRLIQDTGLLRVPRDSTTEWFINQDLSGRDTTVWKSVQIGQARPVCVCVRVCVCVCVPSPYAALAAEKPKTSLPPVTVRPSSCQRLARPGWVVTYGTGATGNTQLASWAAAEFQITARCIAASPPK